jgi:hypothetical protein
MHFRQPLQGDPTLFGERHRLPLSLPRPEVIAQFVVRTAEAGRPSDGAEAPHRVGALLDAPVILFQTVV